jgi:uncharacterized membrane protein
VEEAMKLIVSGGLYQPSPTMPAVVQPASNPDSVERVGAAIS